MNGIARIDDFYYPVQLSDIDKKIKRGKTITQKTMAWMDAMQLVPSANHEIRKHFEAISGGPFATLGWPYADEFYLQFISDLLVTLFVVDDLCDGDTGAVAETEQSIEEVLSTFVSFWHSGDTDLFTDEFPLYTAISDLRYRLIQHGLSETWLKRFAASIEDWLEAVKKEIESKQAERMLTVTEYHQIRGNSGASNVFIQFVDIAQGFELSHDEFTQFATLRTIADKIVTYPNELLSYPKDKTQQHPINLISTFMHHHGMTLEQATNTVVEIHNEERENFDKLASEILSIGPNAEKKADYIHGLCLYMHGLFTWQLYAQRYSLELLRLETAADTLDVLVPDGVIT